jgi:hypothetical protein
MWQILPISVITADNTPAHAAARSFASFLIDRGYSLHRRRSQLTPRQYVTQSPPKCFGGQLQGKIKLLMPVCFRAPQLFGALRYPMDNWQLQHSRSLAFDEQRHQDLASIGKFDRVVMAMRHIWFDHTKLGNAEVGCSRPDPSLVVLNVSLEG